MLCCLEKSFEKYVSCTCLTQNKTKIIRSKPGSKPAIRQNQVIVKVLLTASSCEEAFGGTKSCLNSCSLELLIRMLFKQ